MKTSLVRIALAASAAALTACGMMAPHQNDIIPQDRPLGPNRYLQDASTQQLPDSENSSAIDQPASTDTTPLVSSTPKIDNTTSTTLPTPPPPTSQYPYGKPVPGKKGFVMSPYDDKAGMIDVRDYAPGTKVRDPYTEKIFLVP
ncbi:MAG: hypothetical protein K8R87_11490 [Verrucomicrobia bacterium]|nr:hypothetical protein [Verrucomicrobiota bacterium]